MSDRCAWKPKQNGMLTVACSVIIIIHIMLACHAHLVYTGCVGVCQQYACTDCMHDVILWYLHRILSMQPTTCAWLTRVHKHTNQTACVRIIVC
jgi:hypothetical protein